MKHWPRSAHCVGVDDTRLITSPSSSRLALNSVESFGPDSTISRNFGRISYSATGSVLTNYFDYEEDLARARQEAYLTGLGMAEGILHSAAAQLERHGVDRLLRASRVRTEGAR